MAWGQENDIKMDDGRGKICKCNTKKIRDFSILFRKNILRFAQNCVNLPSTSENILKSSRTGTLIHANEDGRGLVPDILMSDV